VAVEFDGSVLVLDRGLDRLVRIKVGSHEGRLVADLPQDTRPNSMTIDQNANNLVRLRTNTREQLVRIDRGTGAQKVLASDPTMGFSTGMARATNGTVLDGQVSHQLDGPDHLVRFGAASGVHSTFATTASGDVHDVTVAGVNQILPTPPPNARSDTFTMERPATEIHATATNGPLGNDQDPAFGMTLKGEQLTQPSHGFVSFLTTGTGEFFYFPPTGFIGTDSFTYRVRAPDGRVSTPAAVRLNVLSNQRPVANDDHFLAEGGRTTTIAAAGVLANDTDPQGDPLIAKIISAPHHGLGFLDSDGTVVYTPAIGFSGDDSLTYQARDPEGHVSSVATATIAVSPPPGNKAPSVSPVKGGTLAADGLGGTFKLSLSDSETPTDKLKLSATSSNTALIPTNSLTLGGTGATRTLGVKAAASKSGPALITMKVADATGTTGSFTITVTVGTEQSDPDRHRGCRPVARARRQRHPAWQGRVRPVSRWRWQRRHVRRHRYGQFPGARWFERGHRLQRRGGRDHRRGSGPKLSQLPAAAHGPRPRQAVAGHRCARSGCPTRMPQPSIYSSPHRQGWPAPNAESYPYEHSDLHPAIHPGHLRPESVPVPRAHQSRERRGVAAGSPGLGCQLLAPVLPPCRISPWRAPPCSSVCCYLGWLPGRRSPRRWPVPPPLYS